MEKLPDYINAIDCPDAFEDAGLDLLNAAKDVCEMQMGCNFESVYKTHAEQHAKQNEVLLKEPILSIGIAILARLTAHRADYLDMQHTNNRLLQELAEATKAIAESNNATNAILKDLIESVDCAGAGGGVADSETVISLSEKECILAALKARWLKLNPDHTEAQYLAAIRRFELIAGV